MGNQSRLITEKACGSRINPLKAAVVKFERAPQGTREQALAFERLLRALASNHAKSKRAPARQGHREAA